MATVVEIVVAALIVIGAFFLLVGSLGLAKLPDLMRRLHAPTKATTLGIGATLVASMIAFTAATGSLSVHELLIAVFLFLTAPVTAHMIAKAHMLRHPALQQQLPSPPGTGWATLAPAPVDPETPRSGEMPPAP
ncbi:MAG: Na+/H+ antiporter subunit G [Rhodovulum sp.]|nr:Na+/H+ antiporter subunit G [Rhodovulum sp.]